MGTQIKRSFPTVNPKSCSQRTPALMKRVRRLPKETWREWLLNEMYQVIPLEQGYAGALDHDEHGVAASIN